MRELIEEITFHPMRNRQFLLDWMDNISIDWPISRRRWYHTEIPIWYSEDEQYVIVPPSGTYVQPWREDRLEAVFLVEKLGKMLVQLRKWQKN